jgi:hypothetical protein
MFLLSGGMFNLLLPWLPGPLPPPSAYLLALAAAGAV